MIVDLEGAFETLMIFIGIDESFTAFSPDQFSPITRDLYLKHIPVDGDWFPRTAEIDIVDDEFSGFFAGFGNKLCKL